VFGNLFQIRFFIWKQTAGTLIDNMLYFKLNVDCRQLMKMYHQLTEELIKWTTENYIYSSTDLQLWFIHMQQ